MELEFAGEFTATLDRLAAAAGMLQLAAERLAERENTITLNAEATISRLVATVETQREGELERRLASAEAQLAAAEAKIAQLHELQAAAAPVMAAGSGRKTLPIAMVNLLAKQGVAVETMEAGALDAALVSLSLEQRIAVKSEMRRAGLLG